MSRVSSLGAPDNSMYVSTLCIPGVGYLPFYCPTCLVDPALILPVLLNPN